MVAAAGPLLGPHRLSDPRRHLALGDARRAARPGPAPPRGRSSGDRARLAHLADALAALEGIEGCRVSAWSRTLTLDLRPEEPIAGRLLDAVEGALRDCKAAGSTRSQRAIAPGPHGPAAPSRSRPAPRRLMYLALAGGSFAMTLVGLVVPGIPTVPFLLTTSYYLARSSPPTGRAAPADAPVRAHPRRMGATPGPEPDVEAQADGPDPQPSSS